MVSTIGYVVLSQPEVSKSQGEIPVQKGPLSYLSGSLTSALFCGSALSITWRIIGYYNERPPHYSQRVAQSIATAVKTLLVGTGCLATFTFGLISIGLFLLLIRSLLPVKPLRVD
jgi:hypothetical protein